MTRRLTVKADPQALSMAAATRSAAQAAPLFVLTGRALGDLAAELGGIDVAAGACSWCVPVTLEREPEYWAIHWRRYAERR